jgi:hypothetical protein
MGRCRPCHRGGSGACTIFEVGSLGAAIVEQKRRDFCRYWELRVTFRTRARLAALGWHRGPEYLFAAS